jgi:hypothetical protein
LKTPWADGTTSLVLEQVGDTPLKFLFISAKV